MEGQLFDFPKVKVEKKIRLIELFGGIGSQAMALRDIGADFEHYRLVEFDKYAVRSYNAIHGTNFETMDIKNVHGVDLGIERRNEFTYLLTYLLLPVYRFVGCRKNAGHEQKRMGRGKSDKKRPVVGSGADFEGTSKRAVARHLAYGKCAASPCGKKPRRL